MWGMVQREKRGGVFAVNEIGRLLGQLQLNIVTFIRKRNLWVHVYGIQSR